jgi:hypothetical protein
MEWKNSVGQQKRRKKEIKKYVSWLSDLIPENIFCIYGNAAIEWPGIC